MFIVLVYLLSIVTAESPISRAERTVVKMTLDEKIGFVHSRSQAATNFDYSAKIPGVPRLGVPELRTLNGPSGSANKHHNVTCFPCTLAMVSTWDVDLMRQVGVAIGWEQVKKGANVHEGPMVNIARVPRGGRNWEGFGEDPHLASAMVSPYVEGVQSNGIIAVVKHVALNNFETDRGSVDVIVSRRTFWEVYMPAFSAAIKSNVGSFMCSYNKLNGDWACQNEKLLKEDLKGKLKYEGWIMSDWGATHSTIQAANAGLDTEMPSGVYFDSKLKECVINGSVPMSRLDDMVKRVLTSMYAAGLMDRPQLPGNTSVSARNSSHDLLARKVAQSSIVLAKNSHKTLPLNANSGLRLVVMGDSAVEPKIHATPLSSGNVLSDYVITPMEGIRDALRGDEAIRFFSTKDWKEGLEAAKTADAVIICVSSSADESLDRPSLSLNATDDQMIDQVSKVQKKTIVVTFVPGPVVMPWIDQVAAVIIPFWGGQEIGNALASILFGQVSPSGKLPMTFPRTEDKTPVSTPERYPGINKTVRYTEELLVGYRWYEQYNEKPLFPFGHGLSYTTFSYSRLAISSNVTGFKISFRLLNSGSVAGAEVAQLYVRYPDSAGEPLKVLKGFQKIHLRPKEVKTIDMELKYEDLRTWDEKKDDWISVHGKWTAHVGSSSADIRRSISFEH